MVSPPLAYSAVLFGCLLAAGRAAQDESGGGDTLHLKRLLWRFDFDERSAGNKEALPMFWNAFRGEGFPVFVRGGFDNQVGHDAPPSFRLELDGRNVAFRYDGPHTQIRTASEYLVEGWMRADELRAARAALSAYYLDHDGLPLEGTQRFSALVGPNQNATEFVVLGADAATPGSPGAPGSTGGQDARPPGGPVRSREGWRKVTIRLEPAPPAAERIGLTAWVVQPEIWQVNPQPRRTIQRYDVTGGAWFDDISIYRLPTIRMRSAAVGNVFVAPDPPTMLIDVADERAEGLSAAVKLLSSDAELLATYPVPTQTNEALSEENAAARPEPNEARPPMTRNAPGWDSKRTASGDQEVAISFEAREPGVYTARLEVHLRDAATITRDIRFACVEPTPRAATVTARAFGTVLDSVDKSAPLTRLTLLTALGVGSVELPVWTAPDPLAGSAKSDLPVSGIPGLCLPDSAFLQDMIKRRMSLTGVFAAPPLTSPTNALLRRSVLDVLSDDPSEWRDALAAVVAPYASVFRSWQLGADGDRTIPPDRRLPEALDRLRAQIKPFLSHAELTTIGSVSLEAGRQLPADFATLTIDQAIGPDWVAAHLEPYRGLGYRHLGVWIEPDPGDVRSEPDAPWRSAERRARLTRWARRIIHARHAGADTVFIPQPWTARPDPDGVITEPTEEFVVFHTIASVLGDAVPAEKIALDPEAMCLAFKQGEGAVLVLWDPTAPPEGRLHTLQLGSATQQIDLWGRASALRRAPDGRHQIQLSPTPVFVQGSQRWLPALYASVSFTPLQVEFSLDAQQHTLHLANPASNGISAEVRWIMPENWEAQPNRIAVNLAPGGKADIPVTLRYPASEPAGIKPVKLAIQVQAESPYYLEIPLQLELGLRDIEVWGYAIQEGDRLVMRHGVTNRSPRVINLRSFAIVPGHLRQSRLLTGLAPGESTTTEYRFPRAADLSGRSLRLGLREANGSRIHNLELIAP
ncbi:MAG TPA: hypothetical protein VGM03_17075 [Phycisphaerae bacterium]